MLEALRDLDSGLQKRGSRLIVLRGNPVDVIPEVLKAWNISTLCFEHDTEPYALERDGSIRSASEAMGVKVSHNQ